MTWVAAADFRRARDDGHRSHPCLVYGKVEHLDDSMMIGAVASGSAEAKLSHLGARLAVRAALGHLRGNAAKAAASPGDTTGERARAPRPMVGGPLEARVCPRSPVRPNRA